VQKVRPSATPCYQVDYSIKCHGAATGEMCQTTPGVFPGVLLESVHGADGQAFCIRVCAFIEKVFDAEGPAFCIVSTLGVDNCYSGTVDKRVKGQYDEITVLLRSKRWSS